MAFSILAALFEAWVLLIEINRQEKAEGYLHLILVHPTS
jgi:hypothetical protein